MEKTKTSYLTFPIAILQGAFTDIRNVCYNAMYYAFYVKYTEVEDVKEAEAFIGIEFNYAEQALRHGKGLFDRHGQNCTMVSVNRDIVFEVCDKPRTEFEVATFLAFCGLRSILGTKAYTKTNNEHLMSRMAGYNTYREFKEAKVKIPYFDNFATPQKIRYQLTEKIIRQELCLNWGLEYYSSRSRGFCFSFVIPHDKLVEAVEKNKKSYKLKEKKTSEKEAIRAVKKRLGICG